MRISDWSSDVCSSDLRVILALGRDLERLFRRARVFLPHLFFRAGEVGLSRRDVPAALRWFQRRAGFGLDLLEILVVLRAHRHIADVDAVRSEEHTSELQSLMRISYAVFCLTKKNKYHTLSKTYSKCTTQ